jgi:hypothetical protein
LQLILEEWRDLAHSGMAHMSHHSIHLEFPPNPPFDQANWFETFVGKFVKPLLNTRLVAQYWFTRYGDSSRREIRLRVTTPDYATLEEKIQTQIEDFGFTDLKDETNQTVFESFTGNRILSPDAPNPSETDRAQLLLNLNHAIAVLFVECLVGPDAEGRFRQERNTHPRNPHGSIFETVHHLLCDTTDVVTEVVPFVTNPGTNTIIALESPLYASQLRSQLQAQGSFQELSPVRVHF